MSRHTRFALILGASLAPFACTESAPHARVERPARPTCRDLTAATASGAAVGDPERPTLAAWTDRLGALRVDRLGTDLELAARDVPLEGLLARDDATLVAFWATYCPPCLEEMGDLGRLSAEGRSIVGVSMDAGATDRAAAVLRAHGVRYPNAVLVEASLKTVGLALDRGIPFALVVDPCAHVTETFAGKIRLDAARAALDRARARAAGAAPPVEDAGPHRP